MFPCSPVYPTLAVDIRVLDFVRRLFLRIAPNYTAWCSAVVDFLSSQGYHLPGEDPLRRRFSNALQWFIYLDDQARARINTTISRVRVELIPGADVTPTHLKPATHCQSHLPLETLSGEANEEGDEESGVQFGHQGSAVSMEREDVEVEGSTVTEDSDGEETEAKGQKRVRTSDEEVDGPYTPLSRPSQYLRSRCLLCFGGRHW